jgi:ABC-type taurine transport system substrate-binding protein
VDLTHEVGDVILPNVFLSYDDQISQVELTEENRDQFLGTAKFLEIYNEQKDYYVEDYGLSV